MQTIKYIENSFDTLPLKTKVYFYALPILIIVILFITTNNINKNNNSISSEVNIRELARSQNIVDILKKIESYAQKEKIEIANIKTYEEGFEIEVFSSLKKRIYFLAFLENINSFSKIETFDFLGDKTSVKVNFDKFYKKDSIKIDLTFLQKNIINETIQLKAIIEDKALINNKWLGVEESIDGFQIDKIDPTRVYLSKRYENKILKLYKNENF